MTYFRTVTPILTIEGVDEFLDDCRNVLLGLGYKHCEAVFTIHDYDSRNRYQFHIWYAPRNEDRWSDRVHHYTNSDSFDLELFNEVKTFLRGVPSYREQQKQQFLKALSDLRKMGEDFELPADWINPLATAMEELSSNILPAPNKLD